MMRWRRNFAAPAAALFTLLFSAGCADSTMPESGGAGDSPMVVIGAATPSNDYVLPPITVTVPACDPYTDLSWCQDSGGGGGQECMSGVGFGYGGELALSSCPDAGSGGGGGDDGFLPPPSGQTEGPGAFAACVASLFVLMGSTAMMDPLAHGLYDARNAYHSTRRMYDAVMANNPSVEMELLYEHRLDAAKSAYDDAVQGYALGAGASVLSVIAAVAVCSPGLLLPTP